MHLFYPQVHITSCFLKVVVKGFSVVYGGDGGWKQKGTTVTHQVSLSKLRLKKFCSIAAPYFYTRSQKLSLPPVVKDAYCGLYTDTQKTFSVRSN